jgi:Mlc titration factor MtfA (ptsG expression regulator)
MVFGWFRRRRRRRYLEQETPADWAPHLAAAPFVHDLSEAEVQRLVALARAFEEEVAFEGCGGMELDEGVVRAIALHACRLVLYLGLEAYRNVRTVLVYPRAFRAESDRGELTASGLAVPDGPVILAWDHAVAGSRRADDGHNVVYHEFAHKLDMLDGVVDGIPPLPDPAEVSTWRRVLGRGHRRLRLATRRGRQTLIDAYGAMSETEFFAEATEVFFERPRRLERAHPSLYRMLARFYKQDPGRRTR